MEGTMRRVCRLTAGVAMLVGFVSCGSTGGSFAAKPCPGEKEAAEAAALE